MRIAIMATLALAGCSTAPATWPQLQPLDTGLTRPCIAAPRLPAGAAQRGLSERQAVEIIGRYDVALADCTLRHGKVVEIYVRRDAAISGAAR